MTIKCPQYINTAFKLLEESGFEAYIVGGCVRDALMNKQPNDWDMTTSSTPEQTMAVFKNLKTIPTGIKHGTVTVIIDGECVEITTMRIDGEYHDSRRPDRVEYTSDIYEDLSRRDFTVNAIAYNHSSGLVDPYNGKDDIISKTIRCVGEPDKRFNEDALRIFRAVRFSSVLSFTVDERTSESIRRNKDLLKKVANERIRVELIKTLQGANVESVLTYYKDIIFTVIPELEPLDGFLQHTKYHIYDIWTHTVKVVANVSNTKNLRMAALLHDIGKPEKFTIDSDNVGHFKEHPAVSERMADIILHRLKFSNSEIIEICQIIALHDMRPNGEKKQIAKWCSKYTPEIINKTIEIMKADAAAQNPCYYEERMRTFNKAMNDVEEIIGEKQCLRIKDLKINGNDLIEVGLSGKKIGAALDGMLDKVINCEIENERNALLEFAKTYLNKI